MTGLTLDAGALIAFERNKRQVVQRLRRADELGHPIFVPAGVLGQVWRDGRRQARLAQFLATETVQIVALTDFVARAAGQLCGVAGTSDVIDASVVMCARSRETPILTSDPKDLRQLDSRVLLIPV